MKRPLVATGLLAAALSATCGDQLSPVDPLAVRSWDGAPGNETATARSDRPDRALRLRGRFTGTQTVTPLTPPFASVEGSATGNGTSLGRFTMEFPHTVNFATGTATGTSTIVAANGDLLIATFTGQAQVGPVVSIVEDATITGGTGRFEGASGSFTIEREFDQATGTTTGSFEGTISVRRGG